MTPILFRSKLDGKVKLGEEMKYIYGNQDVIVNMEDVRKIYITQLSNDDLAPTQDWMYCVDVDWKERGSCTLSVYLDRKSAVTVMSEWKNVDDELPPKNKFVLVVDVEDEYKIDYFEPKCGWDKSIDAVAWLEIEPYVTGKKE